MGIDIKEFVNNNGLKFTKRILTDAPEDASFFDLILDKYINSKRLVFNNETFEWITSTAQISEDNLLNLNDVSEYILNHDIIHDLAGLELAHDRILEINNPQDPEVIKISSAIDFFIEN